MVTAHETQKGTFPTHAQAAGDSTIGPKALAVGNRLSAETANAVAGNLAARW